MTPARSANAERDAGHATRALRLAAHAVPVAAGAVLLLFVVLAFFAQPADDDFCFAARVRDLGYAATQAELYRGWTGRFVASGAISAFVAAGDLLALYPLGAILVLVATLAAFLALVASVRTAGTSWHTTAVAAAVLTVLFVTGTPDPAQTFYWLSGSLTYQLGNVAIVLLAATLVLRERLGGNARLRGAALFAAASTCAIAAVGANEVALVLAVLILGIGSTAAWYLRRPTRWFLAGVLAIACVAALFAVLAPGNVVRAGGIDGDGMLRLPGVLATLALLPWVALRVLYWLAQPALWAAALLVLAATLPACRRVLAPAGRFDARFLGVPALWMLALIVLSAIGFAVNRYPLPERAESVVYVAFLLGWFPSFVVLAHWAFGARLERSTPAVMRIAPAVLLVAILGAPAVVEAAKDVYRGYRFAGELRARHAALRTAVASGTRDAVVASLSRPPRTLFATDVTTDPTNHRNRCTAQYFGLQSIRLGTPAR